MGDLRSTEQTGHVPSADPSMFGAGPGWYFDPIDEATYRFWNGDAWTDRTSDNPTSKVPVITLD